MSDIFNPTFELDDSSLNPREKGLKRLKEVELVKLDGKHYLAHGEMIYSFDKARKVAFTSVHIGIDLRKIMRPPRGWDYSSHSDHVKSYLFGIHSGPRVAPDGRSTPIPLGVNIPSWMSDWWLIANESENGMIYLSILSGDKRGWDAYFYSLDGLESVGSMLDGGWQLNTREDTPNPNVSARDIEVESDCELTEIEVEVIKIGDIDYLVDSDNNVYDYIDLDLEEENDVSEKLGKYDRENGTVQWVPELENIDAEGATLNDEDIVTELAEQIQNSEEPDIKYVATIKKTSSESQEESLAAAKVRGDYIDLELDECETQLPELGIKPKIDSIRIALGIDDTPNMVSILIQAQRMMGLQPIGIIPEQLDAMVIALGI